MPRLASVADQAPKASDVTDYDRKHFATYLRLLGADAEGVEWVEAVRTVLHIDPSDKPKRARRARESHLERQVAKRARLPGFTQIWYSTSMDPGSTSAIRLKLVGKHPEFLTEENLRAFLLDCANQFQEVIGFSRSKIGQRALHDPAFFTLKGETSSSSKIHLKSYSLPDNGGVGSMGAHEYRGSFNGHVLLRTKRMHRTLRALVPKSFIR
jgi:hypothetical protein